MLTGMFIGNNPHIIVNNTDIKTVKKYFFNVTFNCFYNYFKESSVLIYNDFRVTTLTLVLRLPCKCF